MSPTPAAMRRALRAGWLALGLVLAPSAGSGAASVAPVSLEDLRGVDLRLATIGHRLAIGNGALCDASAPMPGLLLQSLGQFAPAGRAEARAVYGFEAPVAVEAVVPGSAAAAAGVRANDSLLAIDGDAVIAPPGPSASSEARDRVLAAIAAKPPGQPLRLTLLHGGVRREATLAPSPGCPSSFEVLLGPAMTAHADGQIVQIGLPFLQRYRDDQLAAVVAHEFAHNVLRHRVRLRAAGVSRGKVAEFGRSGRLVRLTEDQADQLSVALLYNAGYDPAAAARFWREHGGDVDGGLLRSRTHASSGARAKAIEAEIARIPAGAARPYLPPVLATRDQPLG